MNPLAPVVEAVRALANASLREVSLSEPLWLLGLLALLPLAVRLYRPQRPVMIFSRTEALASLPKGWGHVVDAGVRMMVWIVSLLLCIAAAGPTVLGEPDADNLEGIDIIAVLDVSGSMRAADFKPRDRLYVAKQVIARYLLPREKDRIGLVVFAGEAFTQAPLTHDKELLAEILDGVRTGVIKDGTAIGDALATGVNRLRDSEAKSRVMILVTDGDNNAGNIAPENAASIAAELGVKVYPILVGRGGRVPFPRGDRDLLGMAAYDYANFPTNPELLQSIATSTQGQFFSASDPQSLIGSFQQILEALDKSRLASGPTVRRPLSLRALLVFPAMFLLFVALVLAMTRGSQIP